MAIYHCHGQIIARTAGRSSVGAAAYRAGQALYDKRLDKVFDYTRKHTVDESRILGPESAPDWLYDRQALWNTVEAAERINGQLAREIELSIPIELARKNRGAAKQLVCDWARDMFVTHGLFVDISFHNMRGGNPHAHIMITTRPLHVCAAEFAVGSPLVFGKKARHLNDRGYMDFWRETWADYANAAMAAQGIDARIDHRSLADQGITDREPGIHVGPNANAMWERGIETDRWGKNAWIWFENEEPWFEDNRRYVAFLDEEAKEERRLAAEAAEQAEAERRADAEALKIVVRADDLGALTDRLEHAMTRVTTAAAISLRDALACLEKRVVGRIAAKAAILARAGETLTDSSPLGSIECEKKRLAELGDRLHRAADSGIDVHARRLDEAQATLRAAAALVMDSRAGAVQLLSRLLHRAAGAKIALARTKVADAIARLDGARPTFGVEVSRLRSLVASLDFTVVARVRDQRTRLRELVERFEIKRPTQLAHVLQTTSVSARRVGSLRAAAVGSLIEAARYAGESVAFTLATITGRGGDEGRAPGRSAPNGAKRTAADPGGDFQPDIAISYEQWRAEWLLNQLQRLEGNIVRRERGKPRLDLSLIPHRLQESARLFGQHKMIQDWLDDNDAVLTIRLMELINGPQPVVKRSKDRLVAIPNRIPGNLAAFADDKLHHDDVIRLYAEAAIGRWQNGAGGQVFPGRPEARGLGASGASNGLSGGKLSPGQSRSRTSPSADSYDQAARDGWRRGGKGVGDD